ncbi:MAG: HAD family phosphatase [Planctomycetes bacterium]|nr:HAD family phosphatase [Planctomycetota bacterium]
MFQPYAALLLDLDGTVVDSEPKHIQAHRRFLATQGITPSDELIFGNIGKSDRHFYSTLIQHHGIQAEPEHWMAKKTELLKDLYRIDGLALRPGALELLDNAYAQGICTAIVTSSERRLCALSLEAAGLAHRLPIRVCHEDTVGHKPDPAPYLLAMRRLSVPASRCLVVEDSISGVTAGKAAGCTVVGFPGLVPEKELIAAGADHCVASLASVLSLPSTTARLRAANG